MHRRGPRTPAHRRRRRRRGGEPRRRPQPARGRRHAGHPLDAARSGSGSTGVGCSATDWETYPVLRFSEAPPVVGRARRREPPRLGAGEAAQGPTAAAIANAVHARARRPRPRPPPHPRRRRPRHRDRRRLTHDRRPRGPASPASPTSRSTTWTRRMQHRDGALRPRGHAPPGEQRRSARTCPRRSGPSPTHGTKMFRNGVLDHAIKELCRVYISRTVNCEFCGNQRSVKGSRGPRRSTQYDDLLNFESSDRLRRPPEGGARVRPGDRVGRAGPRRPVVAAARALHRAASWSSWGASSR